MIAIVGAGLAGTTLAWQLHLAGQSVMLFDRDDPWAASKSAAGLITPVTGLRLAKSWQFETLWPIAKAFYQQIETRLGKKFFHEHDAIRLFQTEDEQKLFEQKSKIDSSIDYAIQQFVQPLVQPPVQPLVQPLVNPLQQPDSAIIQPFGGFIMRPGGHLNVQLYLQLSRFYFLFHSASFTTTNVNLQTEISLNPLTIKGLPAKAIVFCQGFAGAGNPYFPQIVFNSTQGEVLTLEIDDFGETRTLHSFGWLLHKGSNIYAAGSTYDRANFSSGYQPKTSEAGREVILGKLSKMIRAKVRVLNHQAGIRPIIQESQPVFAISPIDQRIFCLNGLGSKGSLVAPWISSSLTQHLLKIDSSK